MTVIWKYQLRPGSGITILDMPEGAQPLTVQSQGNHPCLWALVDPEMGPKEVRIRTYATGEPILGAPVMAHYVGTYQICGGLVFHAFVEQLEEK
jgi:hypothetical protein